MGTAVSRRFRAAQAFPYITRPHAPGHFRPGAALVCSRIQSRAASSSRVTSCLPAPLSASCMLTALPRGHPSDDGRLPGDVDRQQGGAEGSTRRVLPPCRRGFHVMFSLFRALRPSMSPAWCASLCGVRHDFAPAGNPNRSSHDGKHDCQAWQPSAATVLGAFPGTCIDRHAREPARLVRTRNANAICHSPMKRVGSRS
jgi:hypothetical protein